MNLKTPAGALYYLIGRRFEMHDDKGKRHDVGDVTFVAGDPKRKTIRVHGEDGARETWQLDDAIGALLIGVLVESATAAPFVLEPISKFARRRAALRIYIAGPNKKPMRGFRVINGGRS